MGAIAGKVFLKIDGELVALGGSVTVGVSDLERETIVGVDAVHGYKEMPKPPFIEAELTRKGISVQKIKDQKDATITAELIDGTRYVLRNAWVVTAIELDAVEGKFNVRWEGVEIQESVAQA
jgi:hypothetical protein